MKWTALVAVLFAILAVSPISAFIFRPFYCARGPSFYCRDEDTAKSCAALAYCAANYWPKESDAHHIKKNDEGDVISNDPFDFMTKMMDQLKPVRKAEASGATDPFDLMKKMMKNQMKEMDSFMNGAIDESFREMDRAMREMDPRVRTAVDDQEAPSVAVDKKDAIGEDGPICEACISTAQKIHDKVSDKKLEQALIKKVTSLCAYCPVREKCNSTLRNYIPQLFAAVKQLTENPKVLCEMYGLCSPSEERKSERLQLSKSACSICSSSANQIKTILRLPGAVDVAPNFVCGLFGLEQNKECLAVINSMANLFHVHDDPALICSSSFCSHSPVDSILEKADEGLEQATASEEEKTPTKMDASVMKKLPKACKICVMHTEWWIKFMEKKIIRDKPRMLWGCKFAIDAAKCKKAVENYVNSTLTALKKACPYKICAHFGYCPTNTTSVVSDEISVDAVDDSSDTCDTCVQVATMVKSKLSDPTTQKEIQMALEALCNKAGTSIAQECVQAIKMYLPQLFDFVKTMKPKELCQEFGWCPKTQIEFQSRTCSACSSGAHQLTNLLRLPTFAEGLPKTVCRFFEPIENEACVTAATSMLAIFQQHFDPAVICSETICSPTVEDNEKCDDHDIEALEGGSNMSRKTLPKLCKACVVRTEKEILAAIKWLRCSAEKKWSKGCRFAADKDKCNKAVEKMINNFIKGLKKTCPYMACAKFGFCPAKPPKEDKGFIVEEVDVIFINMGGDQKEKGVEKTEKAESKVFSMPMMKLDVRSVVKSVPMTDIGQPAKKIQKTGPSDLCVYCEEIVNYIKIILSNPEEIQSFKLALLKMCDETGSVVATEVCKEIVNEFYDPIIKYLAELNTKQTCVSMHMCKATPGLHALLSSRLADTSCSACRRLAGEHVLPKIASFGGRTEYAITACHLLGLDDLACHKSLTAYLAMAEAHGAADRVCEAVCHDGVTKDFQVCMAPNAPPSKAASTRVAASPPPQPSSCSRCVEAVEQALASASEKLTCLEDRLTKACQNFPPLMTECTAAVRKLVEKLKKMSKTWDAKDICEALGECIPKEGGSLGIPMSLGVKGGRAAQLATLAGIGPVIPDGVLGGIRRPSPDEFRTPDVIQPVATERKPSESKILVEDFPRKRNPSPHFQGVPRVVSMNSETAKGKYDFRCSMCEFVVDEARKAFTTSMEAEALATLVKGCRQLEGEMEKECMQFMEINVQKIMDMWMKKLTSKEICQFAKVCPTTVPEASPLSDVECYACEFAFKTVRSLWWSSELPSIINSTLHSMCLKAPEELEEGCFSVVDQIDPVINAMMSQLEPEMVCATLGACSSPTRSSLLGAGPCAGSPSSWCNDWKRAMKCERVSWCKANGWGRN